MYQGEEARLRSGSVAVARERKHLALCINNQVRAAQEGLQQTLDDGSAVNCVFLHLSGKVLLMDDGIFSFW